MIHLTTPTLATSRMVDKVQQRRHKLESKPNDKLKRYEVIDDLIALGYILDRAILLMKAGRTEDAKKVLEYVIKKRLGK